MQSRKIVSIAKDISGSDTLKSLPGVGCVASLLSDTLNLSDKILYKKCKKFFDTLNNELSDEEKTDLMRQFDETYETSEDREEFGERLLEYMNSMNDSYKATLAAKIFKYWMSTSSTAGYDARDMTENDFYHVLEMMNNMPVDILRAIEDRYSRKNYHLVNNKYELAQYGIYTLKVDTRTIDKNLMNTHGSDDLIKKNKYGEILEKAIWNGEMYNNYGE